MRASQLILKKRSGGELSSSELDFLLRGYVDGSIPDYQMAAFLMACYFRGMSGEETLTLTRLMADSGERMSLADIPGRKVDKHSTGGVGDKTSLLIAPIVASCGVPVPMISGRGLGHTGGTLDKLESIPGFRTDLPVKEFKTVLRSVGVAMAGQTDALAPADKKMYALRDVTGTIECIPLIVGSIMSKKYAEGTDALVLDVKTGRGAFLQNEENAVELTRKLVDVGTQLGVETVGFVTDMSQPLGRAIGNWLEIVEAVECLKGERSSDLSSDLLDLSMTLAGAMLMLGGKAKSVGKGVEASRAAVTSGKAFEKFLELVKAQGGDPEMVENPGRYPASKFSTDIPAGAGGFVSSIDALELGLTSVQLGAGREKIGDPIDPKAGIVLRTKVGTTVREGDALATLYSDNNEALEAARQRLSSAFHITPDKPAIPRLILSTVTPKGVAPWPR